MDIHPKNRGQDDQLLRMLADSCFTLVSIADANGMSLTRLAEWYDQPHIRSAIDTLKRIAADRADLIAKDAASTSLSALTTLCTSLESEERNTLPATDPRSRAIRARNRDTLRKMRQRPPRRRRRRQYATTARRELVPLVRPPWDWPVLRRSCPRSRRKRAPSLRGAPHSNHSAPGTRHGALNPNSHCVLPGLHNQYCHPASESPDPATAAPTEESG